MERLLADATKLSGVEYNMDNLGDVYDAIHVIQQDLGLTGVAADEASTTFTGSFGAMKAAGENLLASLTLGEDIGPALDTLSQTIQTFAFNNLFPMIGNIISALPGLLSGVSDFIVQALGQITERAPEIAQQGLSIATALLEGIINAAPALLQGALSLISSLVEGLLTYDWMGLGIQIIDALSGAIDSASSDIFSADTTVIDTFLNNITTGLPLLLEKGVELISNLVNGILQSLPNLINSASTLINSLFSFLVQNGPKLTSAGIDLVLKLAQGIIQNLPAIVQAVQNLIKSFIQTIVQNLPTILSQGITIVGKLVAGLIQAIPTIVAAIPQLIQSIVNGFGSFDWLSIGKNIVKGIADGLKNAAGMIAEAAKDAAKKAFDAACDFLRIDSPSKKGVYIGEMYDAGIAKGIAGNESLINDAISDLNRNALTGLQASATYDLGSPTASDNRFDELLALLRAYLPEIAEREGIDVNQLFNGINRQLGWGVQ